jgi:hypothetical protein
VVKQNHRPLIVRRRHGGIEGRSHHILHYCGALASAEKSVVRAAVVPIFGVVSLG